jgi:hypothetical protein
LTSISGKVITYQLTGHGAQAGPGHSVGFG